MIDAGVILCERCGYSLEGLGTEGVCPECGATAAESDPDRRTGSAWQRRPSPGAWLRTNLCVLARPVGVWRGIRMERSRSQGLLLVNTFAGAMLTIAGPVLAHRDPGATITKHLPLGLGVWALLLGLTWIEWRGIRFFGSTRRWRTTRDVAWAVCGHASVGWALTGLLVTLVWIVGAVVRPGYPVIDVGGHAIVSHTPTPPWWWLLAAFFVGMLVFETLVYIGFRACRYANAPRG